MSRIVDLTLTLTPGMRGVEILPKFSVEREGWNATTLQLYSHAGTHMDAPVHFAAGPGTIDQLPVAGCMGRAWLVNLAGIEQKTLITSVSVETIAARFRAGDSLLFRTDWSKHVADASVYRDGLPRISEDLAAWCVERRVKLLGVEPPSIADVNNLSEVTRTHKVLLGGGVTIIEGLCNLDQLTGPLVFLAALPLKIAGGDGCPCRAFAVEGEGVEELLAGCLR